MSPYILSLIKKAVEARILHLEAEIAPLAAELSELRRAGGSPTVTLGGLFPTVSAPSDRRSSKQNKPTDCLHGSNGRFKHPSRQRIPGMLEYLFRSGPYRKQAEEKNIGTPGEGLDRWLTRGELEQLTPRHNAKSTL